MYELFIFFQISLRNYIFKNVNFHYAIDFKSGESRFLRKHTNNNISLCNYDKYDILIYPFHSLF